MIESKTTWSVEGPYEDQMRKSTGEKNTRAEAVKAAQDFMGDIDPMKLRLVKTIRTVRQEFQPFPRCGNCQP